MCYVVGVQKIEMKNLNCEVLELDIEEIKDFVYEVRTFGITSNDTKFVQITEYLLSELEKEKEENKRLRKCHLQYEEITGIDLLLPEKEE